MSIAYNELYDFCLDWQMGYLMQQTLKEEFVWKMWNFNEFKELASRQGWYVKSMDVLGEMKCM